MKVNTSLSAGKEVVVLFLDLTKAFNCVDADTLVAKCNEYGFRGKLSNRVESFLKNRNQYVGIIEMDGCIKSSNASNSTGVPQGSVLGPLFVLF